MVVSSLSFCHKELKQTMNFSTYFFALQLGAPNLSAHWSFPTDMLWTYVYYSYFG